MAKKKSAKRRGASCAPVANAVLFCDAVSRDPNSKKATIYGVFNQISSAPEINLSIYAKVSRGSKQNVTLSFRFVDESVNPVGPRPVELPADFSDEQGLEIAIAVGGLKLKPGRYWAEVRSDGEAIGRSYGLEVISPKPQRRIK